MFGSLRRVKGGVLDIYGIWEKGRMEKDVNVLMFHRIGSPREFIPEDHCISEENFEDTISSLAENYEFISLNDLSDWLRGNRDIPEKSVVITFDDGFISTKEKALPILEKYEAPATVFIPSNFLNLDYPAGFNFTAFLSENDEFGFIWEDERYSFVLNSEGEKREAYDKLTSLCSGLKVDQIRDLCGSIGAANARRGELLDEEELLEFDKSELVSIGAHSTDHRKLTNLEFEEAKESIEQSKEALEDILGHEISSFSFPFGAKNRKLVRAVEDAGYENAVVTEEREISERDWGNVYRIPRVDGRIFNIIDH